jgi:glycosyltransferase involved in cell wall biosynthesis
VKILLLANYENDRQESMQRFAALLDSGLKKTGVDVETIRPRSFFGRWIRAGTGIGKWLGYLDKFVIFPFQLRRKIVEAGEGCVVHICDHSNAFYTRWLQETPHLVTCNDLLAIRSAHGDFPQNRTGFTGRCLQWLILDGLRRARRITCISHATKNDLLRFLEKDRDDVDVTYMGMDASSWLPLPPAEADGRLQLLPGVRRPYILHVGGGQWYKNRAGVVAIHEALGKIAGGTNLVLVGPEFKHATDVIVLPRVEDETLRALYSSAELLLFPSLEEGFGWPIVEAQACGCRVVTTQKAPMTEAGGDAAFYLPAPDSKNPGWSEEAALLVKGVLAQGDVERAESVARGLKNAARFSPEIMAQRYVVIYKELLYKT